MRHAPDWHCRLETLDDLAPLQQLTRLTQLGTEGNPCCNLHPVSRFRIEVLARHSTSLQQIDSHKVSAAQDTLRAQLPAYCLQPTCQSACLHGCKLACASCTVSVAGCVCRPALLSAVELAPFAYALMCQMCDLPMAAFHQQPPKILILVCMQKM